jgi:hypothetical protein
LRLTPTSQGSPIHLTLAKGCFGRFMCVCGWSRLVRWSSRQMVGHDSATSMLLRWHALAPVPSTTSRHAPQMPPGYSSGLGHAAYSPAQSSEGAAGRSITPCSRIDIEITKIDAAPTHEYIILFHRTVPPSQYVIFPRSERTL